MIKRTAAKKTSLLTQRDRHSLKRCTFHNVFFKKSIYIRGTYYGVHQILLNLKLKIFRTNCMSVLLYGCEQITENLHFLTLHVTSLLPVGFLQIFTSGGFTICRVIVLSATLRTTSSQAVNTFLNLPPVIIIITQSPT